MPASYLMVSLGFPTPNMVSCIGVGLLELWHGVPRLLLPSFGILNGVATIVVAALGVGLHTSCRMASLCSSPLNMVYCIVGTLGVGFLIVSYGVRKILISFIWFSESTSRRYTSRRSASVCQRLVSFGSSAQYMVFPRREKGAAMLGVGFAASCRIESLGSSVINMGSCRCCVDWRRNVRHRFSVYRVVWHRRLLFASVFWVGVAIIGVVMRGVGLPAHCRVFPRLLLASFGIVSASLLSALWRSASVCQRRVVWFSSAHLGYIWSILSAWRWQASRRSTSVC
jgi:hypothetical protein